MGVLLEAAIFIPLFRYLYLKKVIQTLEGVSDEIFAFAILFIKISSLVIFHDSLVVPFVLLIMELVTLKDMQFKDFFDHIDAFRFVLFLSILNIPKIKASEVIESCESIRLNFQNNFGFISALLLDIIDKI